MGCFLLATWFVASAVDPKPRVQPYRIQAIWLLMVFIAFGPFLETTAIGQVNTFAPFFVLAPVFLSEMEHPVLAGLALEIAILEKTSPILFVIYFLLIRRCWVVISAIVSTALPTFRSQILFSGNVIGQFFEIVPRLMIEVHVSPYNQSLHVIVLRLIPENGTESLQSIWSSAIRDSRRFYLSFWSGCNFVHQQTLARIGSFCLPVSRS